MTDQKPKFISNLMSFSAIMFGLLAAFSGTDIPVLLSICAIVAMLYLIWQKHWHGIIHSNAKVFLVFLPIAALISYMVIYANLNGIGLKSTKQYLIGNLIIIPFFIYSVQSRANDANKNRRAIIAGFGILSILLALEAIDHYRMYRMANPNIGDKSLEFNLGRAAYIALIMFWPTLLALQNLGADKKYSVFAFVITGFIATQFGIDLNMIMFVGVGIAVLIATKFPKVVLSFVTFIAISLVILAPPIYSKTAILAKNLLGDNLPMSYGRRADMWLYASEKIKEKPIFGWGLDGARNFQEKVNYAGYEWAAIQMHPHSAPLHIWLEGGIIGATLVSLIILMGYFLVLRSKKLSGKNAWAYIGLYSTILFGWSLSYSIWEQWLWAVTIMSIGFAYLAGSENNKQKPKEEFVEIL
ncbi:MAG: O-antigen ligase family protein [Caulobacterales bacterium]|nr:O-antigen ligase family protein [Caulobacterales bacterium]MCA0372030.1 O-antigen ligase family protein [Pseudomonadota bacterium]